MNINQFIPKNVNVEKPLENVVAGEGTFQEILDKVYDGTIYPLVNNSGCIVGIGYETGKTGAEDSIEQMIFTKRYQGKDVMGYFEVAYKAKMEDKPKEEVTYGLEKPTANAEDLPKEVQIDREEIDGEVTLIKIKKYLKEKYNHYLSGFSEGPDYKIEDDTIYVSNIEWGRKI